MLLPALYALSAFHPELQVLLDFMRRKLHARYCIQHVAKEEDEHRRGFELVAFLIFSREVIFGSSMNLK